MAAGLEGAIQALQRWVGTEEPVLQTRVARCRCVEEGRREAECSWRAIGTCATSAGCSGSWVGMVHHAISKHGVTLSGGLGLPKRRDGDFCLVDRAPPEERELVRLGCLAAEVWRASELVSLEGNTVRAAAGQGGAYEKLVWRQGRAWGTAVRRLVQC